MVILPDSSADRRLQRAINAQPELIRRRETERRMLEKKQQQEEKERRGAESFRTWFLLEGKVQEIERQRDRYAPKTRAEAEETWDPRFCQAVRELPTWTRLAREAWEAYLDIKTDR